MCFLMVLGACQTSAVEENNDAVSTHGLSYPTEFHPCDQLATGYGDRNRHPDSTPANFSDMNIEKALDACADAVASHPKSGRFLTQYSRILLARGDYTEARKVLERANAVEYPVSYGLLGFMYLRGQGVAASKEVALRLFRKGAEAGNSYSQYMLGRMLLTGTGIDQDYELAKYWFQQAADRNNDRAQYFLGKIYAGGYLGQPDMKNAYYWFRKSANQGYPEAQFSLAVIYANGLGLKVDVAKAYFWALLSQRMARLNGDKTTDIDQFVDAYMKRLSGEDRVKISRDVAIWKPKALWTNP